MTGWTDTYLSCRSHFIFSIGKTMKKISILGSTGSIGVQTLDVIKAFPDQFNVVALSAGSNLSLLCKQIEEFQPNLVCVKAEKSKKTIANFIHSIGSSAHVISGSKGLIEIATQKSDLLVVAIVGTASLAPTYAAIKERIPIGLACKEVLVSAGDVIMALAKENGVPILPIDSEHAA
ncbi:MAG: 1-deoxy-D-xylulose-5-phosphate reductoisomerase, partial [Candidatus Marinamargulisbacteria bacterium]